MEKLTSTSLIEMLKNYLDTEQQEKLEDLFKSYERLEISRLRSAYAAGAFDMVMDKTSDVDSYIKNKFEI